jgi:hypothetical protein
VGREDQIGYTGEPLSGRVIEGLILENVEGGSAQLTTTQGADEGRFVHHPTATRVDQYRTSWHPSQGGRVDLWWRSVGRSAFGIIKGSLGVAPVWNNCRATLAAWNPQRFLLDSHARDRPTDDQLLDLLGAFEDVVGPSD